MVSVNIVALKKTENDHGGVELIYAYLNNVDILGGYFETMFTVVLSYLAMGTTLTMLQIFGGLIVLAGVYVYEKRIFNGKKITITVRANRP